MRRADLQLSVDPGPALCYTVGGGDEDEQSSGFVYGTLMTGQCADNRLEGAVFAGPARLDGYALYDLGRYPGIVAQPGGTVWGELWYTDDQTVEQMDLYEEEGSLYRRSPVRVLCGGTLREAEAYVYLHEVQGEPWTERWHAR